LIHFYKRKKSSIKRFYSTELIIGDLTD